MYIGYPLLRIDGTLKFTYLHKYLSVTYIQFKKNMKLKIKNALLLIRLHVGRLLYSH